MKAAAAAIAAPKKKPKVKAAKKPSLKVVRGATAADLPAPQPKKPEHSPAKRVNRGLTMKQEKFCQAYVSTGSASEAYRRAYDTSGCKPASVNRKAFELLENVKITARVAELRAAIAERAAVTVESLCAELSEAMQIAKITKQPGAYVQAVMAKAKLLGMIVDKGELKTTQFVVEAPAVEPTTEAWLESIGAAPNKDGGCGEAA